MIELLPGPLLSPEDMLNLTLNVVGYNKSTQGFPKHNIYIVPDKSTDEYFLELALAGYDKSSLNVSVENGYLVVSSYTPQEDKEDGNRKYLFRGMARRNFSSNFYIGQSIRVKSAKFADGVLTISLEKLSPKPGEGSIEIE